MGTGRTNLRCSARVYACAVLVKQAFSCGDVYTYSSTVTVVHFQALLGFADAPRLGEVDGWG